jgi:hypothetical protein
MPKFAFLELKMDAKALDYDLSNGVSKLGSLA